MAKPKADRKAKGSKPKAAPKAKPAPTVLTAAQCGQIARGEDLETSAKPAYTHSTVAGGGAGPEAQAELGEIIKRYRGRPTKYDPAYCEAVIVWGVMGKSKAWMCGEMMVARTTLDAWIAENDDFRYAMDTALHLSQQWWEDKGQNNLATTGFQGAMYSRSMAARFPQDWREKLALTDPDGDKLVVTFAQ